MPGSWRDRGRGRGGGQPRGGYGSGASVSSRKPCFYMKNRGSCKFEAKCRYSHDLDSTEHNDVETRQHDQLADRDPEAERVRANYNSWRSLIRRSFYIDDLHLMKRIWEEALGILNGDDRDWRQALPKDLQDDTYHGLQHIQSLINKRARDGEYDDYIEASRAFLQVMTHSAILDCLSVDTYTGTLYNFISGTNGNRAVEFFQHLCEITVARRSDPSAKVNMERLDSTLIALCIALSELLRRESRARYNDGLPNLITTLETAAELMMEMESQFAASTITRIARNLRDVVARASGLLNDENEVEPEATQRGLSTYPRECVMPGNRHDNDKADFTQIEIFPTRDEILSDAKEFLPSTDPDQPHFLMLKSERYIDTHFRLLRHDTFGKLKNELGGFLQEVIDDPDRLKTTRLDFKDTRTYKYTNAFVSFLSLNSRGDFQARMAFHQPRSIRGNPAMDRRRWWEESRRLEEGILLSYIWMRENTVQHVFFIVAARSTQPEHDYSLTSKSDMATITVKLATQDQAGVKTLLDLSLAKTHGVLLEFPHVAPATFVPVLQNLQSMQRFSQLSFHEWILPDRVGSPRDATVDIPPPLYARSVGFTFDLAPILRSAHDTLILNPNSRQDDTSVIDEIEQKTDLDQGQCVALVAALKREFAFIQGPPGTGKSYLGIKLMKVILAAKRRGNLGPIVVVCYTNHALDQFLEHLINTGILKIVRVGGQSRSLVLENHNLRSIASTESKSKHERWQAAAAYEKLNHCENRAQSILRKIHGIRKNEEWKFLQYHLRQQYPNIHAQFNTIDDEGFKIAGRHPFDVWLAESREGDLATDMTASPPSRGMTAILAKATNNIRSLSTTERQALVEFWIQELQDKASEELFEIVDDAREAQSQLSNVHEEINRRVLQEADVIGLTTSGLAKNISTLRHVQAKVVICEEAGEVLEAHIISTLLPSVEHFIQIGDHQQLRPSINNYEDLSLESKQGVLYQLDRSQFERLCVGEAGRPAMPVAQLNVQRRMRPDISTLIRETIYSRLIDHDSTLELPDVIGMRRNVFWLDHDYLEVGKQAETHHKKSQSNDWEVGFVHALVRHIVRQGVYNSSDIAVLTPYTGQLQKLRGVMRNDFEIVLSERDEDALAKDGFSAEDAAKEPDMTDQSNRGRPLEKKQLSDLLRVATVDNFQGEEAKIIIVSLVRSNTIPKVGFLKTTNRINVLLSRAQHGMYLIGNADTYSHVPMWQKVIEMLRAKDAVGPALELCCPRHMDTSIEITQPEDFARFSPEGGCQEACTERLPECGHRCQARCHSKAMHEVFRCEQPCKRRHQPCDHPCQKATCGESCGICMIKMDDVALPCGHIKHKVACHLTRDTSTISCSETVAKKVPGCGHIVQVPCPRDVGSGTYQCSHPCGVILACGHPCPGSCGRCNKKGVQNTSVVEHEKCIKPCGRRFGSCNHVCPKRCHDGSNCGLCTSQCEVACKHSRCTLSCHEPCAPCIEPCTWFCEHQGGCKMPCSAPCDRLPCSKRCTKVLHCGHQCPGMCGEECLPDYCKECDMKLDDHVDMLEFKQYQDIDLNETPVIALACGHFFTAETLDGTIGLSEVYDINPMTGDIVRLKDITGTLAPAIPKCPQCQRPIRQYATQRYNRLINRAVIDEMTKRFIVTGQTRLKKLEDQVENLELELETSRTDIAGSHIYTMTPNAQSIALQKIQARLGERYKKSATLRALAMKLRKQVADQHQPATKLRDATVHAMQRKAPLESTMAALGLGDTVATGNGDHRIAVGAKILVVKTDYITLQDQFRILASLRSKYGDQAAGIMPPRTDPLPWTKTFLSNCEKLITECATKSLPRLAVEASLYYSQIVRLFETSGSSDSQHRQTATEYHRKAQEFLEKSEVLCEQGFGNSKTLLIAVKESIKLLQREWYEEVTSEEIEAIKSAMVSGPGGIATHSGHWYNCVNGHPFAIGECGMPMELARCPDCGAPIGGQNHRNAQGVTRAESMEGGN